MGQRIILKPMAQIDSQTLEVLRQSLEQTFNCLVEIKTQISSLDYAYNPKRRQYLASTILSSLGKFGKEVTDRCMGIVDVDLYSPGLSFIFGEADIGSRIAIVSLYRLKPERYGLPHNAELFRGRAIKEAVHELGHTYYLSHCSDAKCVMHFSNSLADTDIKRGTFCPKCELKLREVI